MNDEEGDIMGLSDVERDLIRRLARLGPLMREQEQSEAGMDQAFTRGLRASLIREEERASGPAFARNLRPRLTRKTAARPIGKRSRPRLLVLIGSTATAVVVLLISAFVAVFLPQRTAVPRIDAPYPTKADLIFSFPAPPTAIRRLLPTLSLVHPRSGVPYGGHLRFGTVQLPKAPANLQAYRLAPPTGGVIVDRRLLGIRAPVRRVVSGSATWAIAQDGGFPSRRPLHSVAVSLDTGELIYHDRRNLALPRATRAVSRSVAVRVARRWLSRLGWPGNRMPLVAVEREPGLEKVREMEFGWIGVGKTETDAATLWVTPNRSIIEAWIWPPVVRRGTIPARSISAAWADVRKGTLPLAVEGVPPRIRANGAGAVQRTTVVSILTPGVAGTLYLVPTYRFEGKAHIPGASFHTWYSLAPGAKRRH